MLETNRPVLAAFSDAWYLKWRFLVSHVALGLLAIAVISPVTAFIIRVAIGLSGNPALADQDIAYFLLSPVGFVCLIAAASVIITAGVLDTAFLMSIHLADQTFGRGGFRTGLGSVLPRLPAVASLAARLTFRIVLIAAPFLLIGLWIAARNLTAYDINYYLTERPPEFLRAVGLIGAVLAVMAVVLINRLLTWMLTLPLVLFSGIAPGAAFAESARLTEGFRVRFLRRFAVWAAISLLIGAVVLGLAAIGTRFIAPVSGGNLAVVALFLLLAVLFWVVANVVVTTITSGAFAVLIADAYTEAGGVVDTGYLAKAEQLPGLMRKLAVIGPIAGALIFVGGFAGNLMLNAIDTHEGAVVIAHRGAAGARPENTMAAVEEALRVGTDYVEIDVQESADGEVIVVHDSDFMKLAGVPTKVWDVTAEELAEIDIGSWFDPQYAGERTPTLRQVLQAARDRAKVLIELKYYDHDVMLEQRVLDIVAEEGMEAQVAYMSLKLPAVEKTKGLAPEATVGLLAATAVGDLTALEADFLAVNTGLATRGLVRRAEAAGKPVYVWTVNDALTMSQMLSRGVSGLITDEPALAREVIARHAELSLLQRLLISLSDMLGVKFEAKAYRDASP
ncbi:Glycerophosphoryl diester phosphodiesterase [Pseudoruegeria aquimaris]|uniref:Glycerophosphoryl diester phosphodiesterase n=1 Tax=Pseudoruegeria aquimaris TaxID=393663 RepID=A0A1Y5T2T4_9RHOB|nr:glycerophosphodiester phosphodiesterase family protein [Pseudoruegeria aquimaris]SLN52525.1 Glycerophosphoryl diester phosphodiesterase [Pseudoruegeria aquimaris]